jgi:mono/diheme cytochrome c family protein
MSARHFFLTLALAAAASLLLRGGVSAQSVPADAKHGAAVFHADGCYECHGYQAEGTGKRTPGGLTGPMLAPQPIPYTAFVKQLRAPRNVMPSYSAKILSDGDARDIYAYLESIPAAKSLSAIRLLHSVDTNGK